MDNPLTTGGVDAAAGAEPGLDAPRWFYVIHGRRMGPISTLEMTLLLQRGPYDPQMLVWRQGMLAWAPVSLTAELLLPGLSPLISPPPVPVQIATDETRRRNARANCVGAAIFLGLMCGLMFVGAFSGIGTRAWFRMAFIFSIVPTLYMAIYLPLRYRVIQSLSPGYRLAGMVGGIGLILLFLASLVLSA